MSSDIGLILEIKSLNFGYDPIGSLKNYWLTIDRNSVASSIYQKIKEEKINDYNFIIFGNSFCKNRSEISLCLDNGENMTFIVSEIERGRRCRASVHSSLRVAIIVFLLRAIKNDSANKCHVIDSISKDFL